MSSKTLIIGSGRLATHLCHFFSLQKLPYDQWNRHSDLSLENLLDKSDRVLLAISDRAISDFITKNERILEGKTLVHFSATVFDPRALGFHPLSSFSHDLCLDFSTIHFHGVHPESLFREALPMFKNHYAQLNAEDLRLYHALCVVGGNFPALLWKVFFTEMQKIGISDEATKSYFNAVFKNIQSNPLQAATGPLVRGDMATIERNLDSLSEVNPNIARLYEAFVHAFAPQFERGPEKTNNWPNDSVFNDEVAEDI